MELEFIIPIRNCPHGGLKIISNVSEQIRRANRKYGEGQVGLCVVDDASDDYTAEVVSRCLFTVERPELRILKLEKRVNAGGARNAGVNTSNSRRVAFLDADDDIVADAVETILGASLERRDADVIMWGFQRLNKDGETAWLPKFGNPREDFAFAPVAPWIKAVKKDIFVPFPEGVYCEDCAWWFLQAEAINSIEVIPLPLYIYDRRGDCFSSTLERFANHPRTLEDLAYNNIILNEGGNDRAPSDCLRNLAEMYDIRNRLKKPSVRKAWMNRFHNDYLSVLSGRWAF